MMNEPFKGSVQKMLENKASLYHERIYRNHPALSRCGINVRSRSSILKINYRTTEESRKSAFALLMGISFDDLDDDFDLGDRCQSLTHGEKPVIWNFNTASDENVTEQKIKTFCSLFCLILVYLSYNVYIRRAYGKEINETGRTP